MYSKTPSRLIHCVCPITPQSVDATPATAVIIGSNPINGITMKASTEVEGVITSITLASGQVIAYSL